MHAYFITATGTAIGKTWLASALCRRWRAQGRRVAALKPVMSGYDEDAPQASDAGVLLAALGEPVGAHSVARIAPWRFRAPLSPDMAAAREGRSIDFAQLVAFCQAARQDDGLLLVEGVGGCMAPLDARHTVRDWIAALDMPAVLVAGSYLGSLSHTLTALAALRESGVAVAAVAINESEAAPVSVAQTAAAVASHADGINVVAIERAAPDAGIARLAQRLAGGLA